MASRLWVILTLFICSYLAAGSRIIIDPKSCAKPAPQFPSIGIDSIQKMLDEAFVMAQVTKSALEDAVATPGSEHAKRVNYVMKNILAAEITSPYFARVFRESANIHEYSCLLATGFFDRVLQRQAGKLAEDLTIYCNEDFRLKKGALNALQMYLDGRPIKGKPLCGDWIGYASSGNIIVICPNVWNLFPTKDRQTLGGQANTNLDAQYVDTYSTVSGLILHELLHSVTWGDFTFNGFQARGGMFVLTSSRPG